MAGVEVLTEKGYSAAGIDEILKRVGVPKGSFYHYFKNKESFGLEILECYAAYFARKLELHFCDNSLPRFGRIHAFVEDAKDGLCCRYAVLLLPQHVRQELVQLGQLLGPSIGVAGLSLLKGLEVCYGRFACHC